MSAKKSYNRFFIIFQEEDKGYGVGPDRPPTGYVKVETKNDKSKVTVYVQNLKSFEAGDCLYKGYLISHQDDKDHIAYLGIMNIDDLGRGESSWECSADNVFDSKLSIEKFNAAAIVVEKEGASSPIAPLAGYMSKEKFEWRSKFPVKLKKVEEVKVEEVKVEEVKVEEVKVEVNKFEEYEKQIAEQMTERKEEVKEEVKLSEEIVEQVTEESREEKVEEPIEEVTETREAEDDSGLMEEDEAEDNYYKDEDSDFEDIRSKHKHEYEQEECQYGKHKQYKNKYMNYGCSCMSNKIDFKKIIKKTLEDILEDYKEMDLHKELKSCRVWKIDMAKYSRDMHKVFMYPCYDLVFYPMINNPSCNYFNYIKKHGHYLFGIRYKKDEQRPASKAFKSLIFGIPGKDTIFEQPYQGITGFQKWISSGENKPEGYWILEYDPMTGQVIRSED